MSRPSWDKVFLDVVDVISRRSTCDRGRVGCVIVKDNRIISIGYAGAPVGLPHCDEVGHDIYRVIRNGIETEHCDRTIHAEQNAIARAAMIGLSIKDAILYNTVTPCYACAKLIVGCGIREVVCKCDYHTSERTKELFLKCNIDLKVYNKKLNY